MRIFISYRREPDGVRARLLHDGLCRYFSPEDVFMDVQDIGWGDNFTQRIDEALGRADVVVVVIGPLWADIIEQRLRGDDWVRYEVEHALQRRARGRLRVLPVFVEGARWKPSVRLPKGLAELPLLNAPDFGDGQVDRDTVSIVEAIRQRTLWQDLLALAGARRARFAGLSIGLLAAAGAWTGALDLLELDTRLATATMALAARVVGPRDLSGKVVLVPIDETAVRAIGRTFGPSWRLEHARLIDHAAAARARVVAFDLFFDQPGDGDNDSAADAALAAAAQRASGSMPVVLGAADRAGDGGGPAIIAALRHHPWGLACAGKRLNAAYSMPLSAQAAQGAAITPSLALAAFIGSGKVGADRPVEQTLSVSLDAKATQVDVPYFGAEQATAASAEGCPLIGAGSRVTQQLVDPAALSAGLRTVAFADLVRGDAVALSSVSDSIVLVGTQLPGVDQFAVGGSKKRWGMELIGAQIDALVQRRTIRSPAPLAQVVVGLGLGLAGALAGVSLRAAPWLWLAGLVVALALGWALCVVVWYRWGDELLGVHYGWIALGLGAFAARRIMRSTL